MHPTTERRARRLIAASALALAASCSLFEEYEAGRPNEAECTGPAERGNGLDDDGDGIVDEGCGCDFEGEERGVCALGRVAPSAPGRCERPRDYYAVEARLCDGLDNDCDGQIDEGCPCSSRQSEIGACALGRVTQNMCRPSPQLEEVETRCDGYDNDCDGSTDPKSLCQTCNYQGMTSGVCSHGQRLPGQSECAPPPNWSADEDDCAFDPFGGDNADNDCDGVVDEGCACRYEGEGRGVCSLGIIGALGCGPPTNFENRESSCDGLDNDCNGQIDEGCEPQDPPAPDAGSPTP